MSAGTALTVQAPLGGTLLGLDQVPDPVFAQGMVGHGMAVDPAVPEGPVTAVTVVAPVAGRLLKVMPHAFVVQTGAGAGVLVHLGIDTVTLEGRGFTLRVSTGDEVAAGDPVVDMDLGAVREAGLSACCPVVVLDSPADAITTLARTETVTPGQALFSVDQ